MDIISMGFKWARRSTGLAVAAAICVATGAFAKVETVASLPFALKPIGQGVYAAIDGPKGESGSNAGFIIGDDGVLVVDSFFNAAATKALIAEIHKLTPKPIRYVVNTHYHADHVAGNEVLKEAGAIIVAHNNVRGWVRTENLHLFGDSLSPQTRAMIESLAFPDITTDKDLIIWLGKRKVLVRTVLGHTGGDLVVSIPDANVLFCGDMLWRHVAPNIIDGNVAHWINTIDMMRNNQMAAGTTFVPGHGDIASLKDVAEFQTYLTDLKMLVERKRAERLSGDALVKAALPDFALKYHDWEAFAYFGPLELRYMDEELAGTKRVPMPADD